MVFSPHLFYAYIIREMSNRFTSFSIVRFQALYRAFCFVVLHPTSIIEPFTWCWTADDEGSMGVYMVGVVTRLGNCRFLRGSASNQNFELRL